MPLLSRNLSYSNLEIVVQSEYYRNCDDEKQMIYTLSLTSSHNLTFIINLALFLARDKSFVFSYHFKDCEDHAVLLCSLLLGFGLNAYVCVGTKAKGAAHTWVMTVSPEGEVAFWESLTSHRQSRHFLDLLRIVQL